LLSAWLFMARNESYEAPHYVLFSNIQPSTQQSV
jgi:hypothetical protein